MQSLDRRRRDVLDPLADAKADREVTGTSLDRDRQRAVCVDESGEESSFLAWMTVPCALGAEVWTVKPLVMITVGSSPERFRVLPGNGSLVPRVVFRV